MARGGGSQLESWTGGENGCRKMHNFALSLTVMGSLKDLPPPLLSSSVAESSSVPLETQGACSPPFSWFWPEAPCRGRCAVLGDIYILHHSQPRAERRVRGPGGLGAEFSRDPGPGRKETITEGD